MNSSARKSQTGRELRELQRLMATAVMRPLTRGDSMQRKWLDGRPAQEIAEGFIKPNDRLDSFQRLEIYNRQYWFRIRDCFYADFPGLRAVLGDRKFERLADNYLAQHPSRSFTLRNLGSSVVAFLERNPGLSAPRSSLVLDMARLEWAHIEAFDNEAKAPLETDDLLDANSAEMRLQFQPHLALLKLNYEMDSFLARLKKNSGLRNEASNAVEENILRRSAHLARRLKRRVNFLAVYRFGYSVYYKRLDADQFQILSMLREGSTIVEACAQWAAAGSSSREADTIRDWFFTWAALGWFCNAKGHP